MVAEHALETINNAADPLATVVNIKSRTNTSLSTCSVATEEGIFLFESRDAVAVKTRGVDGSRDEVADDTSIKVETRKGYGESCAMTLPLCGTPRSAASLESLVQSNHASNEQAMAAKVISSGSGVISVDGSGDGGDGGNSSIGCSSRADLPLLTRAGDKIDAAIQRTGENIDAAIQYFYSSLEFGAEKVVTSCVSSNPCSKSSSYGEEKETSPSNTEAAPKIQTAVDLLPATEDEAADTNNEVLEVSDLIKKAESQDTLKSQQPSIKNAKSQDTIESIKAQDSIMSIKTYLTAKSFRTQGTAKSFKTQGTTKSFKTQGTTKSFKTQGTTKSFKTQGSLNSLLDNSTLNNSTIDTLEIDNEDQTTLNNLQIDNEDQTQQSPKAKSSCCFTSVFTCSGDDQGNNESGSTSIEVDLPPMTLEEIIGDTLNITSSKVHILDTFSDDNSYSESEGQQPQGPPVDYVSPRAQCLLDEIEDIENSLFEVRKTASMEKVIEIKKRQDPFIQQMATIKQHLLDQQPLHQSAPDDTKADYYRAISHAVMLNAEVDTRRAELELKKIRLESMKVQEEMDRMTVIDVSFDDTFDSLDQSLMTGSSDRGDHRAFDVFARFTAGRFHKMRKNRGKGRGVPE